MNSFAQGLKQPIAGGFPVTIGGASGNPHHFRSFALRHSLKNSKLDEPGTVRIKLSEFLKGFANPADVGFGRIADQCLKVDRDLFSLAVSLKPTFIAGSINQKLPYCRCYCEKMTSMIPGLFWILSYKPNVGFVHQRRSLQSLARRLARKIRLCQPAEILINSWEHRLRARWWKEFIRIMILRFVTHHLSSSLIRSELDKKCPSRESYL